MSGLGAMCENIASYNHDDLGCDGWEISAHAASAPDHEPIQGRQYTDADYKALNDSLIRRIGTLNCGHIASPIILGVSKPQYSSAELAQLEANNAAGVTYQGQHYTTYEATQLERSMERSIRADKRRVILARAAGLASHESQLNARVLVKDSNLRRFCKATGLRYQPERLYVPDPG